MPLSQKGLTMNTPKAEGLPIPTVMEEFSPDIPDRTTLVLPLITMEPDLSGKSHEKSHETSQVSDSPSMASKADEILRRTEAVLSAIRSNPNVKTPSIAKALDLTSTISSRSLQLGNCVGRQFCSAKRKSPALQRS